MNGIIKQPKWHESDPLMIGFIDQWEFPIKNPFHDWSSSLTSGRDDGEKEGGHGQRSRMRIYGRTVRQKGKGEFLGTLFRVMDREITRGSKQPIEESESRAQSEEEEVGKWWMMTIESRNCPFLCHSIRRLLSSVPYFATYVWSSCVFYGSFDTIFDFYLRTDVENLSSWVHALRALNQRVVGLILTHKKLQ